MGLFFKRAAPRAQQRERIAVQLADGHEITLLRVRDPRARRIKLLVNENGVRLTLPPRASLRAGTQFFADHRDWVALQLRKWTVHTAARARFARGVAGTVPLRGAALPVCWRDGRCAQVELDTDAVGARTLVITLPPGAAADSARAALREFYLQEARRDLGRWLPAYLPTLPRAPLAVRIRPLASLWGSLSPTDGLSLDLSLVLGDPRAFEYVLVHELCHLIQPNHSRAFWREVETRCPHWRTQRDYLRGDGMGLKAELKRLTG